MPGKGPLTVDVPGVVEGWHQLLTRFGTISLAKAMAPAIALRARRLPGRRADGERVAGATRRLLGADPPPRRRSCRTASRWRRATSSPTRAWRASLEVIAKEGRDAFYKGSIARAIVADMKARDGLLDMRDFADHKADWVEPIATTIAATTCWKCRRARRASSRSRC